MKMVIKRSVEKDHRPTGWILTAVKWFSLGIAPSVAADGDCCYLYLHLICTREMPRASGDRPGGSLSPATWLLQRANCFTSKKKERGKLRGTACAFILQHPLLLYKQSKVTQNTATTWGHCLIILADWCGQQMSSHFPWAGAPWASHLQGGRIRAGLLQSRYYGRTRGKACRFIVTCVLRVFCTQETVALSAGQHLFPRGKKMHRVF